MVNFFLNLFGCKFKTKAGDLNFWLEVQREYDPSVSTFICYTSKAFRGEWESDRKFQKECGRLAKKLCPEFKSNNRGWVLFDAQADYEYSTKTRVAFLSRAIRYFQSAHPDK